MREGWFVVRARRSNGERGASLVEFALVVPLLTLFLFGIVQFGLAYDKKQSINSAAREGARLAAVPSSTFSAVDSATRAAFQGLLTDGAITVTVENTSTGYLAQRVGTNAPSGSHMLNPCGNVGPLNAEGTTVVVTAVTEHVLTVPFFGAPSVSLTGRGEFRCERSA